MSVLVKAVGVIGILITGLMHVGVVAATQITPSVSGDIKLVVGQETVADYMELNPPNSAGISVNDISSFVVSGRPLKLIPANIESENYISAKLVVIKSSKVQIENKISLLGGVSDLLIIDSDTNLTSTLSCYDCSFENFGRVTLAAATMSGALTSSRLSVGKLSTFTGGRIDIRGMFAPVQSLELLADDITTSKEISTIVRGRLDPNGGYTIDPNGPKSIALAGVNFYVGTTAVDYESLKVAQNTAASVNTAEYVLDGKIKAGMISVISSRPFRLNNTATLSTKADVLVTSTHQNHFVTMLEGVYIQSTRQNYGNIILNGDILTDNLAQVVALNDIVINARIQAYKTEIYGGNAIRIGPSAEVVSEAGNFGAKWLANRGIMKVNSLAVETDKAIHNHFGGRIQSDDVTLASLSGTVINGSRTSKLNVPADPVALRLVSEISGTDKYGIYQIVKSDTGVEQDDVSASITANAIHIKAKRFENINPYHLQKAESERWENGVHMELARSRQVSIQAERKMEIDAAEYVLNASAILGLNQAGSLDINSPQLMNQRYRIEANLAVVDQHIFKQAAYVYNTNKELYSPLEVGTYLTAYSPPGVLYSFGELTFSSGDSQSASIAEFINQFSFLEVLSESNFYNSKLFSFGLNMASRPTTGYEPVRCVAYGCEASEYISFVESETLTSFSGNVNGLSSDMASTKINQLEDGNKKMLVEDFIADYKTKMEKDYWIYNVQMGGGLGAGDEHHKVEVTSVTANDDNVRFHISRCTYYKPNWGSKVPSCYNNSVSFSVASIVQSASEKQLINGLEWSTEEIVEKAKAYLKRTNKGKSAYGTYYKTLIMVTVSDDQKYVTISYVERIDPPKTGYVSEADARNSAYYSRNGTFDVLLEDLMGTPETPSNIQASYTLDGVNATFHITWNALNEPGLHYYVYNQITNDNEYSFTMKTTPGENSYSFNVKACNSVRCSSPSETIKIEFVRQPLPSETSSCSNTYYAEFLYKFRTGGNGNISYFCATQTRDGVPMLLVIVEQEAEWPDNSKYLRCEYALLYNKEAIIQAKLQNTPYPESIGRDSIGVAKSCNEYYGTSLYEFASRR